MSEHELVALARKTIETFVKEGKRIPPPETLTAEMKEKVGVFVSLKKQGQLRGCIGTFSSTTENVASEVIRNAIAAATKDPRFPAMTAPELTDLEISVDVLTAPEQVKSSAELDPKKYGVIVKAGARQGLLLPDLSGVNTAEEQIQICRQKAWIADDEPAQLFRFQVRRFH